MDRPATADAPPPRHALTLLRALAREFPNVDAAMAEIARLSAVLTLPKGTVHVVSDVHGEHKKLKHIINNASGSLRPLVDHCFQGRLGDAERQRLLALVYYPREAWAHFAGPLDAAPRAALLRTTVRQEA